MLHEAGAHDAAWFPAPELDVARAQLGDMAELRRSIG